MNRTHTKSSITVMGVGGAGIHMAELLAQRSEAASMQFIAVNTDLEALENAFCDRLHIGVSDQAAVTLEKGRDAAVHSAAGIAKALDGASLVIVLLGLGGGTGSGAAPEIVRIAISMGSSVRVGVAMPALWEGQKRGQQAKAGLAALRGQHCTVTVVQLEEICSLLQSECTWEECLASANRTLIARVLDS